jgi:hypothetical protein
VAQRTPAGCVDDPSWTSSPRPRALQSQSSRVRLVAVVGCLARCPMHERSVGPGRAECRKADPLRGLMNEHIGVAGWYDLVRPLALAGGAWGRPGFGIAISDRTQGPSTKGIRAHLPIPGRYVGEREREDRDERPGGEREVPSGERLSPVMCEPTWRSRSSRPAMLGGRRPGDGRRHVECNKVASCLHNDMKNGMKSECE